jgi:deoxyribodipyrimidine photo-lyase
MKRVICILECVWWCKFCKTFIDKLAVGRSYFALLKSCGMKCNVGEWQWAAGTGCDAAPYSGFHPSIQLKNLMKRCLY